MNSGIMSTNINNKEETAIADKQKIQDGIEESKRIARPALERRYSVMMIQQEHPDAVSTMQQRFPEANVHDLIRFLQKRNFDVHKAAEMYQAHLKWRKATLPIPFESVKDTLATRKFYVLDDADALEHPVLFYCLYRFKEAPYNTEDEIRALIYLIEHEVLPRMGDSFETQQWTVLMDVSGIKSPPLYFLEQVNTIMKANYPNRLFRTAMFPVPSWLQRVLTSLLVFLDEDTRSKFAYVKDIKSLEQYVMMPREEMGADVAQLVKNKKL